MERKSAAIRMPKSVAMLTQNQLTDERGGISVVSMHRLATPPSLRHSPMKPKMSLMVGTKMTSMLLKARMAAAISMWRIQLNSRPLNSSVVMEERIWRDDESVYIFICLFIYLQDCL